MRKCILSRVFIIFFSGFSVAALCPQGDLNGDCTVQWEDLIAFSGQWLGTGECEEDSPCANFDGLNGINFIDFTILANHWLEGMPLVINEFMASNSSTRGIKDLQNEYDDWIEIHNFGDTPINLAGMYLTDDLGNPTKWQIPSGFATQTTIPTGGFLVIWADEDTQDGPLHASFKLSAGGEDIGLYDTDGSTAIDAFAFGSQSTDISYGRYPDSSDNWRFFPIPTAGAINNGGHSGEIEDVEFSHARGFYSASFNLTIACSTSGVSIYYTTDGKAPIAGQAAASGATIYTAPVAVSSTKCVRAAAIKTGWMPSPIKTHTYIFGASNAIKAMPVVSLVGNAGTTFYEPSGIMAIVGGTRAGDGAWQSGGTGTYNNPMQRGIAYERPVSFEVIDLPAGVDYQGDCGIRVHGSNYTRPRYTRGDDWSYFTNKFSFNLFFRNDYGDNYFEYPFFPFVKVDRYQSIVLRGGHDDMYSPFVKDEWTRRVFCEMGWPQVTGRFANLYINGSYKYYYNPCGHEDADFFQEWYGTDNDFDVITQGGVRDGDDIAWNDLINYVNSHDLSFTSNYNTVSGKMDIVNFIDLLILQIHIGNFDWPGNNWTVHRERSDAGLFRFTVWDAEGMAKTWAFGDNCEYCYRTSFEDFPSWISPTGLNHLSWDSTSQIYRALKTNVNFRQLFADRIHRHYRNGGVLMLSHLTARWWEVYDEVSDALQWQNTYVPTVFLPQREPYVLAAFETNGLFNRGFEAPSYNVNGSYQHGGYISAGDTMTMTNPSGTGTTYYTLDGSDPRLPASEIIAPAVSPVAVQYTGAITLDISNNLRARVYNSSNKTWSPLNDAIYEIGSVKDKLRITELMYHPSDPNTEFVELKNISASAINLNLVKFSKGINYTFDDVTLAAGQHILVVENLVQFQAKYPGLNVAGQYTGSLDNSGERIRLADAIGNAILDFEYKDGWRSITDGDGYSLTIINPVNSGTNSWGYKDSWRASAYVGGSPGVDDSGIIPNPGSIVINEVLAHSHGEAADWIELYNTTAGPIDISGWYLSDSQTNPLKYRFAAGTIIAGHSYLVVNEMANFGPLAADLGRLIPFALSENGDEVCLASVLDANDVLTGYREKEDFGASETGVSFGRYYKSSTNTYNFVFMDHITSGQVNVYPKIGPIIITEIMYNPDWPASGSYVNNEYEYIELYNPSSTSSVPLYDSTVGVPWKFTGGIDYTFASPPNDVTIVALGKILIVKNPAAFRWRYSSVDPNIIYGPYNGKLANEGEQLELSKPGDIDEFGVRQYIRVERINFSDGLHSGSDPVEPDLWPTTADGLGKSLGRISPTLYGNDPNNWRAITPTPGT